MSGVYVLAGNLSVMRMSPETTSSGCNHTLVDSGKATGVHTAARVVPVIPARYRQEVLHEFGRDRGQDLEYADSSDTLDKPNLAN